MYINTIVIIVGGVDPHDHHMSTLFHWPHVTRGGTGRVSFGRDWKPKPLRK